MTPLTITLQEDPQLKGLDAPFALRWLLKGGDREVIKERFDMLCRQGYIRAYPVLYEETRKPVVQAEHSVLLTEKETIVLT